MMGMLCIVQVLVFLVVAVMSFVTVIPEKIISVLIK